MLLCTTKTEAQKSHAFYGSSMTILNNAGFQVTTLDFDRRLVVVENIAKGIKYEFPNEFEQLKNAEVHNNYLLVIESKDGRRKFIQLLE